MKRGEDAYRTPKDATRTMVTNRWRCGALVTDRAELGREGVNDARWEDSVTDLEEWGSRQAEWREHMGIGPYARRDWDDAYPNLERDRMTTCVTRLNHRDEKRTGKVSDAIWWGKGNTGRRTSVPGCVRVHGVRVGCTRLNLVPHHGSLNASYAFWHPGHLINQMPRVQGYFFADAGAPGATGCHTTAA
jgi:hypothetical protein